MSGLTIYSYPNNPRVAKALIAAQYQGVTIATPAFQFGVDNKTPEFLAKFPLGKVPVLETPEGPVFESNSIARYVARLPGSKLYGKNILEASQIDQWLDVAVNEIEPHISVIVGSIGGWIPFNKGNCDKAAESLKKALAPLEAHLTRNTFFVGNRISLADIVMTCTLFYAFKNLFDAKYRKEFVAVNRWYTTMHNQPQVVAILGAYVPCETAAAVKPPQKEEKKEEKKPAAAAPAPAAKPAKKPAKEEDEGEEEEEVERKPKNPLDLLPKSSMDFDEFKRIYSNNDTMTVAMPKLWEMYDPTGYSIWFCSYKHDDELTKVFMTSNLIGGWFQRLDNMHKYAMGSMCILGTEKEQHVSGVWIFRGTTMPQTVLECEDTVLYNWTQADHQNPEHKALIERYFAWEGPINGLPFLSGKIFK
jgi:elongation factor 1-gamma